MGDIDDIGRRVHDKLHGVAWTIIRLSDGEVILTGWGLWIALVIVVAWGVAR